MPRYEMGRRAAEMLCQRLEGSPVSPAVVDLGFEIVMRETT
jgi:DNA-binding LacI/PurR family transcriptional regulator